MKKQSKLKGREKINKLEWERTKIKVDKKEKEKKKKKKKLLPDSFEDGIASEIIFSITERIRACNVSKLLYSSIFCIKYLI